MTPWMKKNRFAKSILAGLGGAAWLGAFATAALAQTAVMPAGQPLYFEANRGQADSPAQFIARGRDSQFLISPDAAQFVLRKTTAPGAFSARTVRMQFVDADSRAQISGAEELPGKINYLIGNEPAGWQTGVPTFAKVRVSDIYSGVNLIYYGNQRQLEYDFTIAPGANPGVIAIRFDGADNISIGPAGELILKLGNDEIRQPKPVIYQTANGARWEISGGYSILDAHTVAFAVGDYDRSLPLVIDPILSYSTYFGGSASDAAYKVAVDMNGFVYVAGSTLSPNLATVGTFQTNYAGGTYTGDAFVAKFSYDGTNVALVYCTYLGGSQDDFAYGLAVDNAGDVFLTGSTDSPNFPTNNALYPKILGHAYASSHSGTFYNANAFVTELNTNGSRLVYSTYLGGSGNISQGIGDTGTGIAVDASGNAYVTGFTTSTNFPATNSLVYQLSGTNHTFNHLAGFYNAFLAKIGPGGTSLLYSTYFGGTNMDEATGVAVDGSGSAYVAGFTDSTNFPTTTNAFQTVLGGTTNFLGYNAFVAKFAPSGTNLIYSTFLGGTNGDQAFGIAVDAAGDAYVTGGAASPNFPNTLANLGNGLTNNLTYGYPVTTNAFLTQIVWNGANAFIGYSTVFGGTNFGVDVGYGVAVDPQGNAFVCGATTSTNFPTLNATNYFATTNSGGSDVFVTAFNTNGSALLYSVYLGGANNDYGYGIAVDASGSAYIVGQTLSANFPATNAITTNALHAALNGTSDAFLAKIFNDPPSLFMSGNNSHVLVGVNANPKFEPELPRLFALECSTNLFSTNWVRVLQPLAPTNNYFGVTLDRTNKAMYFRLREF
jgi:hypothetical protein